MFCLIAFILTFFVTRTIVRWIRYLSKSDAPRKWWQPRNIGHGGTHIHHVVIGVVLVMVSGLTMVTLAVDGGMTIQKNSKNGIVVIRISAFPLVRANGRRASP